MKPIKGLDGPQQPREDEPNKIAVALVTGVGRTLEYSLLAGIFMAICAGVAASVMAALSIMHSHVPTVPPFGFMFIWAGIWGSSVLAIFAGQLTKVILKEGE